MSTISQTNLITDYINFISTAKTERLCVEEAERLAVLAGFKQYRHGSGILMPGEKVYFKNKNKNFAAFIVGKANTAVNVLGAHIDAPRIDVKQKPLYESDGIAYFDTQYYGGIKKYQWTTTPLAIHGVICTVDGNSVKVSVGEDPNDPIFCICDLLPHLDKRLAEKKASDFINGEKLDILVATTEIETEDKDKKKVKEWVLHFLKEKYGVEEEDLVSAELEIVPAGRARYSGFDKSLIAGYGQDDRVCAFTSLMAVLSLQELPEVTSGVVLVDKEEIGSCCATGAKSRWFEDVLRCVLSPKDEIEFATFLARSRMLSSDVTAAYDPLYADAYDKKSSAKLNGGIMFSKYNGGRGKSGGADANPEFIAYIRKVMKDAGVKYQFDSMGKVDVGGGGTIASMVCELNINVLDAGVPILNMHSPLELAHVNDIYNAYLGYMAFIKAF